MNGNGERPPRRLRIAIQPDSGFVKAVENAGHEAVLLPELPSSDIHRPLADRISDGRIYSEFLARTPVDLLLDLDNSATTLVPQGVLEDGRYLLTNARHGVPYVSLYIDPVTETMRGVDWATRWALLESTDWVKWVWEDVHSDELRRLGIPNVLTMPMAVDDGAYLSEPPIEAPDGAVVGFVGHPSGTWFNQGVPTAPSALRPGLLAAAANADAAGTPFHEVYYDLYAMAEPPRSEESPTERARKSGDYFQAKFTYNAYLGLRQRDRFVLFLKNRLGDQFELIGDGWQEHLGVSHKPRVCGPRNVERVFRNTVICVNLTKGCAESGLNQRHYEITAAGGFMLTYEMPELSRRFEVGKECETFRNEKELLEKIRYYLAHPQERLAVAQAGQRRTLRDHVYSRRIEALTAALGLNHTERRESVAAVGG